MKRFFAAVILFSVYISCKKDHANDCTDATVTLKASSCRHIGVIIKDTTYPSDDLPDSYAIEGNNICIEYSLYSDPRECFCCGGTYVHIIRVVK